MRFPVLFFCCVFLAAGACSAGPVFPSGYIPFTSIHYVTPPDSHGDRFVVGIMTHANYLFWRDTLAPPSMPNEMFSGSSIELAPGQFFSAVYVPTVAERFGDFRGSPELSIINPGPGPNNSPPGLPFPGNIIPQILLVGPMADPMAIRINAPIPEPATLPVTVLTLAGLWLGSRFRRRPRAS